MPTARASRSAAERVVTKQRPGRWSHAPAGEIEFAAITGGRDAFRKCRSGLLRDLFLSLRPPGIFIDHTTVGSLIGPLMSGDFHHDQTITFFAIPVSGLHRRKHGLDRLCCR